MKLLIITNLFPNASEPNRGLFNLQQVRELAKRCDLTVIAPVPWCPKLPILRRVARWYQFADVPRCELVGGIEVHHPRYLVIPKIARMLDGWSFELGIRGTVRRLVRQGRVEAILATWAYPDVAAASWLARKLRIPLVAKLHGSDINVYAKGRMRRSLIAEALTRCEKVICVSSSLQEKVIELGIARDRIDVIPNGVDGEAFKLQDKMECRSALGLPLEKRVILFVGNLVAVKGVEDLLDAFDRCQDSAGAGSHVLVIVGDGKLRERLERRITALGLKQDVRLVGARPHEEIPCWLGACDVLCLPSRNEGCPNVVLEALACGRPVVGTRAGGIAELVHDGRNGLLVAVGDVQALVAALLKAAATDWQASVIRASVASSWHESAAQVLQVMEGAVSRRRKSPTVLHVLSYSVPNMSGYTHRSQSIIERQKALGARPVVITSSRHAAFVKREEIGGIAYYRSRLPTHPLYRLVSRLPAVNDMTLMLRLRRDIVRVARAESIDVIHAHSPVLCGLPALWAARTIGLPFVYEVRALWEDAAVDQEKTTEQSLRYALSRRLESFVLRRADRLVAICDGLKREIIRRGVAAQKIRVMPNGVDTGAFQPVEKPPKILERHVLNGQRVIGFIGSFFAFEGLTTLLEAVPLIRARFPHVKVLLVGSGEQEAALRRLVDERRMSSDVILTGRVPHEEVRAYYAIMDVLVYPRISKRITELVTPLKPLEAMALGKTVIASDVGGLRELIEDGTTGLLFNAGDPHDLAKKCVLALTDRALSERVAQAGREFVRREKDWTPVCKKYLDLYEEMIAPT